MFDKNQHKTILIKVLKEIYSHPRLRNILGFKGGTAAYLFYDLPRLSIDLDFDLLDFSKKEIVFKTIPIILSQFGQVNQATDKRYTLFFLLSYQKGERQIKIEISKRPIRSKYEVRNYLGIPVLLMKKEDLVAGKLSALLTRKKFAARDLFDLWYFLKNDWQINEIVLKEKTELSLADVLIQAVKKVSDIKQAQLLQGIGELLAAKQKIWIKNKLKDELLFYLKLRLEMLRKK